MAVTVSALALAASAPGCFLPELLVDDSGASSGGGSSSGGVTNSGGVSPDDGTGGTSASGSAPGSTGGSPSGGSGGTDTGGGGTSGGSGGDGSGGGSGGAAEQVVGYYESGTWHGFVSAEVIDGTLTSESPAEALNPPYCMTGTVDGTDGYTGVASFVWNLNQPSTCTGSGCEPARATITPELDGVALRVDNPGGTTLRVQIVEPGGLDPPDGHWCADLGTASGVVFVPWTDFNTNCWLPEEGTYYQNQPIEQLRVYAPGLGPDDDLPFEFCVEVAGESDATGLSCLVPDGPGLGQYSLSGSESAHLLRNAVPYVVKSSLRGDSNDLTIQGSGTAFEILTDGAAGAGVFPGVFVGEGMGLDTDSAWLPRNPFSARPTLVLWRWNGTLPSGGVAALELQFTDTGNATDPPSGSLQFWLEAVDREPGGTQVASFNGTVNRVWEVFSSTVDGVPTAIFLSPQRMPEYLDSPMPAIVHAMEEGILPAASQLTAVSGQFQLWNGGGAGLTTEDFCAHGPPE
jgi:hypothetical protein